MSKIFFPFYKLSNLRHSVIAAENAVRHKDFYNKAVLHFSLMTIISTRILIIARDGDARNPEKVLIGDLISL
jgi:hypothetical protein